MAYKLVARQGKVFFVREVFKTREEAEAALALYEDDPDIRIRGWKLWIHEEE
jgi:hypothetical protein